MRAVAGSYVIPAGDRAAFLGCRRAWDLGARERGNHRPAVTEVLADPASALRHALTVYYFPGMWDWQPQMVLRLVRMAFLDELSAQRARYLREHDTHQLDDLQEQRCALARDRGLALLERYFEWAPTVDELSPVMVNTEFDVQIPDPRRPGQDLATPDGRGVHYRDQVDLLVVDAAEQYWMVEHRVGPGPFLDPDLLRLSERCLSWCWAWELFYPGMRIEGTVFNELRDDLEVPATGPATPTRRGSVAQNRGTYLRPWAQSHLDDPTQDREPIVTTDGMFRRVVVSRARAELAGFGERMAAQVVTMVSEDVDCHPTPTTGRCAACDFRGPCLTMNLGEDPAALLAAGYTERDHEPVPGQLGGGTWSVGRGAAPPDFGGSR